MKHRLFVVLATAALAAAVAFTPQTTAPARMAGDSTPTPPLSNCQGGSQCGG